MMNPDKFLTDLAALTNAFHVTVSWCNGRFDVYIRDNNCSGEVGTGPTVEAAMQEARAKLAEQYA